MNNYLKKKIKVLHIITSLNQGGAQSNLFKICSSCNVNSFVICLAENSFYTEKLNEIGIKNLSLNINKKNIFSIFKIFKLFKIARKFKPDIIQSWLYHADFISCFVKLIYSKSKLIWTIRHTDLSFKGNKFITFIIIRFLASLSYYIPDKIVYCALSSIKSHKKLFYCNYKTLLISNGLDMNDNRYIDFKYKKDLTKKDSENTINFISIGRYHPIKNHSLLINAFIEAKKQTTKKIHLYMIGDNVDEDNIDLKNIIISKNASNAISLLGPKKNVYFFLKKSHFLILSSNSEAFPNVILEASLCCTPSISTDVGDAKKIIGDNGYIIPIKNINRMSNAIVKASSLSQKEYENMAKNTRERSLKIYSHEKMIKNFEELYINLKV